VEKLFMGWGSGFQNFVSSFWVFFFFPSVDPARKYSVWSAEGFPSLFGAGCQQVGGLAGGQWPVCQWVGGQWLVCQKVSGPPIAFVYTNNEQIEKEYRKTIPFTIASKKSNI
jgi:hypothetical protein